MRPRRPSPPDAFYEWVGRVTIAFAQAELQLGMCGWTATTGEYWTEDWMKVTGNPGTALDLCTKAVQVVPADLAKRLDDLSAESKRLRRERNQINHSALILDPETTHESHPWLTRDSQGTEAALLSPARGEELVRALNRLSRQATELRSEIHTRRSEITDP